MLQQRRAAGLHAQVPQGLRRRVVAALEQSLVGRRVLHHVDRVHAGDRFDHPASFPADQPPLGVVRQSEPARVSLGGLGQHRRLRMCPQKVQVAIDSFVGHMDPCQPTQPVGDLPGGRGSALPGMIDIHRQSLVQLGRLGQCLGGIDPVVAAGLAQDLDPANDPRLAVNLRRFTEGGFTQRCQRVGRHGSDSSQPGNRINRTGQPRPMRAEGIDAAPGPGRQ